MTTTDPTTTAPRTAADYTGPQPLATAAGNPDPSAAARARVEAEKLPTVGKWDSDPTTTAPQPATPAEALRWYAGSPECDMSPEGRAWAEKLNRWADQLDGAPAVYALPAEPPPEVTALWDRAGRQWQRKPWRWFPDGTEAGRDEAWIWWLNGHGRRLRFAPLLWENGPLSTTPPAGTETDHG